MIVAKKKILSRYEIIEVSKDHEWLPQDRFRISPYMRHLMLLSGQSDNYRTSEEHLQTYLRVKADDSQIQRLCEYYGGLLEVENQSLESKVINSSTSLLDDLEEEEVVYTMVDGCILPTRPHQVDGQEIGSWREMKLGRVFRQKAHLEVDNKPNIIRESLYVSHFGDHQTFCHKLEQVVDVFESLAEKLVFINDGATWIDNWIKAAYPNATSILDFYHASQYIHRFAKILFKGKKQKQEAEKWVNLQIMRLLNDQVLKVIEDIEQLELKAKTKIEAKQKILTYFKNNLHRMQYQTYRLRGLLIGSGPIESAHRFVLQKRMKQSGQKWTQKGGQAVANIRVVKLNKQWNRVVELINQCQKIAA